MLFKAALLFIGAFIIFALTSLVQSDSKFEIVPKNAPILFSKLSGAHVSYDNYAMIYHIDLGEYYNLRDTINTTIELANQTCSGLYQRDMCTIVISQLRTQLTHADRDDVNMGASRIKRALCTWCGKLQGNLYGTLDADMGKKITDALNENRNETTILHGLMINQTTLFQASLKLNQNNMNTIQSGLNKITEELNNTRNQLVMADTQIALNSKTQSLIQIASMGIAEHLRLYSQLNRAITDSKSHRVPELIEAGTLQNDLKEIAANLKPNQRLPIDLFNEKAMDIFKYAEMTSLLVGNKLLIEINIPIAEAESYALYKATPIPIQTPNGRLIVETNGPYFLLNADKTRFIELSQRDLDNARRVSNNEQLYRPTSVTHLRVENNCIWRTLVENSVDGSLESCNFLPFAQNDVFITIIENEKYFIASTNGTTIWDICGKIENRRFVIGENIVTLDQECYLKSNAFIAKPYRSKIFNQTRLLPLHTAASPATIEYLSELAGKSFSNFNFSDLSPINLDSPEQMQRLIDGTKEMVKQANHEFTMKNITLETGFKFDQLKLDFLNLSGLTTYITIGISIVTGLFILYVLFKLSVFSKIIGNCNYNAKKSKRESIVIDMAEVSTFAKKRRIPNTPHPKRVPSIFDPSAPEDGLNEFD